MNATWMLFAYLCGSALMLEFVLRFAEKSRRTATGLITLTLLWPIVFLFVLLWRIFRR